MNAVIRKRDSSDEFHVAVSGEIPMEEGWGELRADVRHIRVETADIKADLRATNVRIDDLLKEMKGDRKETTALIAEVRKDTTALIAEGRKETVAQFDEARKDTAALFKDLAEKIDGVRDSVSQAKIWALGLYIGLAGALLLVMAHGFKWI